MSIGDITIGPGSVVEQLLEDYGLDIESVPADLVESDTDRLLLALLLEQRGADSLQSASIDSNANDGRGSSGSGYVSGTIQSSANPVDDDDQPLDPGWTIGSVVVRSASDPVFVAFQEPTGATDKIQLDPESGDLPYSLAISGWSAEQVWVGSPEGASETSVTVDLFEA